MTRGKKAMKEGPLGRYQTMVETGELEPDPAQARAAERLQQLADRLADYEPSAKTGLLSAFSRKANTPPEGLYLHGGVGRGKTMLMDLFHETAPFTPRRRDHFHEFMGEVHELIAHFRARHEGDPITPAAQAIAREASLICLDELQVTDIADAMILGRLFSALFSEGVVTVATSNTGPRALYANGLNRPLFEPFVDLLEERLLVMELAAAEDYRLKKLQGDALYFSPIGPEADSAMTQAWKRLTGHEKGAPAELRVRKRAITVPQSAMGAARFSFHDLCERPLGPGDYLAIAHAYHTLLIDRIPVMGPDQRDAARRFITLIDTLYDNGVKVIASAEAEPPVLYSEGDGADAFERTASRLIEMRSQAYLARHHGAFAGEDESAASR